MDYYNEQLKRLDGTTIEYIGVKFYGDKDSPKQLSVNVESLKAIVKYFESRGIVLK